MQTTSPTQTAIAPAPSNVSTETLKTADLVSILLLAVPLLGLLSVISYRQYRARLIKHQMAALERIWKLNSIEKTP